MKKIYLPLILLLALFINACKNPAENIEILLDANVIQYRATIELKSAGNEALNGVDVAIAGADADKIYNILGKKEFAAPDGRITVGVSPLANPTPGKPVTFNIMVTADGYDDKNIPVSISYEQFTQIKQATLIPTEEPTESTSVITVDVPLAASGATTTETSFGSPVTGTVAQATAITIPAGVTFKDAAGNAIVGTELAAKIATFDAGSEEVAAIFPGGSLSADNVQTESGSSSSAFFYPAGFADIQMFVNGQEVRTFSTPIEVSVQVDPNFVPQGSSEPVKVGDQLAVYSYHPSDGIFKFEKQGAVVEDASGKLAVNFETNHLTIFIVGNVVTTAACNDVTVRFSAPWLGTGSQTLTLEFVNEASGQVLSSSSVVVKDTMNMVITDLPPNAVKFNVKNSAGELLSEGSIADPCAGGLVNITLGQPGDPVENVTMKLNVKCPDKGFVLVPTFDLYFKPAGAPNSAYQLLGTVENGFIRTAMLKVGSVYDFRAYWGTQIKTVGNRTITDRDLSTTVEQGGFLGNNDPVGNEALLIEACK